MEEMLQKSFIHPLGEHPGQSNLILIYITHLLLINQVCKIWFQTRDKVSSTLCSETLGVCLVKLLRATEQVFSIATWFVLHQ